MTHYNVLGITERASASTIKDAYHNKMQEYHPDLFQGQPEWVRTQSEAMSKLINAAYAVLSNTGKRQDYDNKLAWERKPKQAPQPTPRQAPKQAQPTPKPTPKSVPVVVAAVFYYAILLAWAGLGGMSALWQCITFYMPIPILLWALYFGSSGVITVAGRVLGCIVWLAIRLGLMSRPQGEDNE